MFSEQLLGKAGGCVWGGCLGSVLMSNVWSWECFWGVQGPVRTFCCAGWPWLVWWNAVEASTASLLKLRMGILVFADAGDCRAWRNLVWWGHCVPQEPPQCHSPSTVHCPPSCETQPWGLTLFPQNLELRVARLVFAPFTLNYSVVEVSKIKDF